MEKKKTNWFLRLGLTYVISNFRMLMSFFWGCSRTWRWWCECGFYEREEDLIISHLIFRLTDLLSLTSFTFSVKSFTWATLFVLTLERISQPSSGRWDCYSFSLPRPTYVYCPSNFLSDMFKQTGQTRFVHVFWPSEEKFT